LFVPADCDVSKIASSTHAASSITSIKSSACNHASASGFSFVAVLARANRVDLCSFVIQTLK
jgi:hypothetical protein